MYGIKPGVTKPFSNLRIGELRTELTANKFHDVVASKQAARVAEVLIERIERCPKSTCYALIKLCPSFKQYHPSQVRNPCKQATTRP